jgi:hypothetical protein
VATRPDPAEAMKPGADAMKLNQAAKLGGDASKLQARP